MKIERIRPEEIERRSFEIITDLLGEQQPPDETAHIVKRVIHTTADLEYAETLYFSENAAQILSQALAEGAILLRIRKWLFPASTKKRWRHLAGKFTALWRTKMLPARHGKEGLPGLVCQWKKLQLFLCR